MKLDHADAKDTQLRSLLGEVVGERACDHARGGDADQKLLQHEVHRMEPVVGDPRKHSGRVMDFVELPGMR
jgi:hypothetical protein